MIRVLLMLALLCPLAQPQVVVINPPRFYSERDWQTQRGQWLRAVSVT